MANLQLVTETPPEPTPLIKQILAEIDKLGLDEDDYLEGTFVLVGDTGKGHTFMVSNAGGISGTIHILEQAKTVAILENLSQEQS